MEVTYLTFLNAKKKKILVKISFLIYHILHIILTYHISYTTVTIASPGLCLSKCVLSKLK